MRISRRWPWAVAAIEAVALVGVIVARAIDGIGPRMSEAILACVIIGGTGLLGALILSRRPGHAIGRILLAISVVNAALGAIEAYAIHGLVAAPGSLPGARLVAGLSPLVDTAIFPLLALLFLLFPEGHPPTPRWRWITWTAAGSYVSAALGELLAVRELTTSSGIALSDNPFGIEALGRAAEIASAIGFVVFGVAGAMLPSVASLVVRWRRSVGDERRQISWLVYVVVVAVALLLTGISVLETAGFIVLGLGVPAACAVAIFRYRLYEIDVVIRRSLIFGVVAAIISGTFVLTVAGLGAVIGGTDLPSMSLTIVATSIVALVIEPARRWATRIANRAVYGKRATPYEALTALTGNDVGAQPVAETLPTLARLMTDATAATAAAVWITDGADLRCAASWPEAPDDRRVAISAGAPAVPGATASYPVRFRGELLGVLAVSMPGTEPLPSGDDRLLADLAAHAGLMLANARLVGDLQASRQRLVTAQNTERRRIERNLHDGAQQQLVALSVNLNLLQRSIDDPAIAQMVAQLRQDATDALENLRDLARGIYPPLLADRGLVAALEAQAAKAPVPTEIAAGAVRRHAAETEATVYFCVLEGLQNVGKYARASRAVVRLGDEDGRLTFEVRDDGAGFDARTVARGAGLTNMSDRVEALGGAIAIESAAGRGTTVRGWVPAAPVEAATRGG